MSYSSYQKVQQQTDTPRQTEARAFAIATGRLIAARDDGNKAALIDALHFNRRLWTVLQMDLAHPDNGLPDNVKAQLISLAIWVQKHTSKAMRGTAAIDPLVEVNQNIMEGLSPQAQPQPQTQPPQTQQPQTQQRAAGNPDQPKSAPNPSLAANL